MRFGVAPMPTETIDAPNTRPADNQPDHGLGQPKPSTTDEVVRRGQEALQRLRRSFEDWMDIAEALQVGRTAVMAAVHQNKPTGKRYAKAMTEWLPARGFHVIDACTRNNLLECLKHRAEIEKMAYASDRGSAFQSESSDHGAAEVESEDRRSERAEETLIGGEARGISGSLGRREPPDAQRD